MTTDNGLSEIHFSRNAAIVSQQCQVMNQEQRENWENGQEKIRKDLWGSGFNENIMLAQQLALETETKSGGGFFAFLEKSGAGSSVDFIAQRLRDTL